MPTRQEQDCQDFVVHLRNQLAIHKLVLLFSSTANLGIGFSLAYLLSEGKTAATEMTFAAMSIALGLGVLGLITVFRRSRDLRTEQDPSPDQIDNLD